jgi:hypothetical protein
MNSSARPPPAGPVGTTEQCGAGHVAGIGLSARDEAATEGGFREDTDNRGLFDPRSKYPPEYIRPQRVEAWYIAGLLALSLISLASVGLGLLDKGLFCMGIEAEIVTAARKYEWMCGGGLLGGTVYAAKWLYHAIAKGLWHEDRKTWRYLSPWISLGTTVGIGVLIDAGFMKNAVGEMSKSSAAGLTGMGFLIGYLSDRFLAKMKEVTRVLFGEAETHFDREASGKQERRSGRD